MLNGVADWIFNVMVWGAIVTLLVLVYESFLSPGFLAAQFGLVAALLTVAVVAVLSSLWPKW